MNLEKADSGERKYIIHTFACESLPLSSCQLDVHGNKLPVAELHTVLQAMLYI